MSSEAKYGEFHLFSAKKVVLNRVGGAWPQPPTHPLLFNDGGVRLLRKDFYVLLCSKVFSILEMFPSTWEL